MQASDIRWSEDSEGAWLCLRVPLALARETADKFKGKAIDAEIKAHRERRSLDANSYCWKLLGELADVLSTTDPCITKESLYISKIKEVGIFKDFKLTEGEAKTFRSAWSMLGTGWPTEQVDYSQDGEKVIIRAYYGSSQYNTKQMSKLIDSIVQDCKDQGIETMTPQELDALKSRWGEVT